LRITTRDNDIFAFNLRDQIYGTTKNRKRGKLGILNDKEDNDLVKYLMKMQAFDFLLIIGHFRKNLVYLHKVESFLSNTKSRSWLGEVL